MSRNLVLLGQRVPWRVCHPRNNWGDSFATTELAKIIIEEVLGYHTIFKGLAGSRGCGWSQKRPLFCCPLIVYNCVYTDGVATLETLLCLWALEINMFKQTMPSDAREVESWLIEIQRTIPCRGKSWYRVRFVVAE